MEMLAKIKGKIDPRIYGLLEAMPAPAVRNFKSREAAVAYGASEESQAIMAGLKEFSKAMSSEEVAPVQGLKIVEHEITSQPDGNTIKLLVYRKEGAPPSPGVVYIHGGGMAFLSCYDENYKCWARLMAHSGLTVAMVEFRNSQIPSEVKELGPFPAGLNDCVSAVKWVHKNAKSLGILPGKIIVAGESGGGNLTLATSMKLLKDGNVGLISGVYALCPFLAGECPLEEYPSHKENNGIFLDLSGNELIVAYGKEQQQSKNPLAWPHFATESDLKGLPPTVISVNEFDPLRDEGIEFYRKLLAAGVTATCKQVMGTMHATEIFPALCPNVSKAGAASIARFAYENSSRL